MNYATLEQPERSATLREWLSGRKPPHLSTNAGTELVAFQSWRNFKEAFAPELVAQAVEQTSQGLGRAVRTAIDPFGGSGTTALASQFLGVSATTIEVNPYLADLIEAKLCTYNVKSLLDDYERLLGRWKPCETDPFPGAPVTFVEPGLNGRYIFSKEVGACLAGIRSALSDVADVAHQRLFRVILASISTAVSNVVVSGKGRRYRRNWKARQLTSEIVLEAFDQAFVQAVYDINRFRNRLCLEYTLFRGDCRELIPEDDEFDVAIFSPPYPNSFDYTDVYNVELWVCGYLSSRQDNRALRMNTLRSHVQIHRSYATSNLSSQTLDAVTAQLNCVRHELWDSSIPDMVSAYFDDMRVVLERLSGTLVDGGRAYMVVGDSRYKGIQVPVAHILLELAEPMGFRKIDSEPFRSMRASPQQGGRPELMESLLVLEHIR